MAEAASEPTITIKPDVLGWVFANTKRTASEIHACCPGLTGPLTLSQARIFADFVGVGVGHLFLENPPHYTIAEAEEEDALYTKVSEAVEYGLSLDKLRRIAAIVDEPAAK